MNLKRNVRKNKCTFLNTGRETVQLKLTEQI